LLTRFRTFASFEMDKIMARSTVNRGTPQMISVVIPVYNAAPTLAEQFKALASQTYQGQWEVVIADNGSTDGSQKVVRHWASHLPHLELVDASGRRGINYARNMGVQKARGSFLAFCDADDVATTGWLDAMANAASHWDLVGGALDEEALNDGKLVGWRPRVYPVSGLPVLHNFLPFAIGANFGIWRDVLQHIGTWNENFAGGGDEVDLCWRAQIASYRLGFAADAIMIYRYRTELRALAKQFYYYGSSDPRLYATFRDRGMPRSSPKVAVKTWAWLLLHAADLVRSSQKRGFWLRLGAARLGRLRGSIHNRVLFL
jgi:GT2 family glycosyltransferase